MLPLVSCIMPTANRAAFVAESVAYFLTQDYPRKELLILDDGKDNTIQGIPLDRGIYYEHRDAPETIGAKRNALCEMAAGDIILHWDDDDVSAPGRITRQVEELVFSGADIAGFHSMVFIDEQGKRAWHYHGGQNYILGTSMCYYKRALATRHFLNENKGEDWHFLEQFPTTIHESKNSGFPLSKRHATDAGATMMARIHPKGTASWRSMAPQIEVPFDGPFHMLRRIQNAA